MLISQSRLSISASIAVQSVRVACIKRQFSNISSLFPIKVLNAVINSTFISSSFKCGVLHFVSPLNLALHTIIELQKGDTNPALELLESDLKEVTKSFSNLMKALEQGIFTNTTKQRMEELEEEKETLELRITQEKIIKKHPLTKEQIIFFLNQFKNGDIENEQFKANICKTFVNKVIIEREKISIFYNYKENGDISSSVYADLAKTFTFDTNAPIF